MRTLLDVLQNLHRHQIKDLIGQLGVTDEEYNRIESGELQMSPSQIVALAELIKASTTNSRASPVVAIYNYNFGPKSHTINYPNSYSENEHIVKPQNNETTNPKTNE